MSEELARKIGQMVVVGFHGTTVKDEWVQTFISQAEQGLVGGLILFRWNIEGPEQVRNLLDAITAAEVEHPLFTLVDQEGGLVQRFSSKNGFRDFDKAKEVAKKFSPTEAKDYYAELGKMLTGVGVNFDFAPCVDVDFDPPSAAIGAFDRSYSTDPEQVAIYSQSFVEGLREVGVLSCLKHFPGHGSAQGDSHLGMVDVTDTWYEEELEPYRRLIAADAADSIMTAHIIHNGVDPDVPATLSKVWLDRLRNDFGYDGVIVGDDLQMGAIQDQYGFEDALVKAIHAGVDILLYGNNPKAAPNVKDFELDPELPVRIQECILKKVQQGEISEERINESYDRIIRLKSLRL